MIQEVHSVAMVHEQNPWDETANPSDLELLKRPMKPWRLQDPKRGGIFGRSMEVHKPSRSERYGQRQSTSSAGPSPQPPASNPTSSRALPGGFGTVSVTGRPREGVVVGIRQEWTHHRDLNIHNERDEDRIEPL